MLRNLLIKASESDWLGRQIASRRLTRAVAMRYVAGESLDDGLQAAREIASSGRGVTLDYLGESVTEESAARKAAKVYLEALTRIGEDELPCGVSVKPTQMGLHVAAELCQELLGDIVSAAGRVNAHVTLDMEGSDVTEQTVRLVEQLHAAGQRRVGCAVQSYLHRTLGDVDRLSSLPPDGASLRLCKGAYAEPPEHALQRRSEVDANYLACAEALLRDGTYPRFATHDDRLIERIRNLAARRGLGRDEFEFQMLYGVRVSLQEALVRDGYRMRVYVPFGDQWYPYLMRRLAERPANLIFFLRSLRDT